MRSHLLAASVYGDVICRRSCVVVVVAVPVTLDWTLSQPLHALHLAATKTDHNMHTNMPTSHTRFNNISLDN